MVEAAGEEDLRAVARVQNIAYGGEATVTEVDLDRLRATRNAGGVVVLARCDGAPAGAGLFTAPRDGLAQLAAGAVLPEYQRRGIASAVCADLSQRAFTAGFTPYLETESHNERGFCGRLGYSTVGEMVTISLPQQGLR